MAWVPAISFAEADKIICAPGTNLEIETRVISGRVQRVYKNLWPSCRAFFLWATNEHGDKPSVVFENKRYTFRDMLGQATRCAAVFRDVYGIKKGDRVAICCRNYPQLLISFWACHLLGAVSALVNAWLPLEPLKHCLLKTGCKLAVVDAERAQLFEPIVSQLATDAGAIRFIVVECHEGKGRWTSMENWDEVMDAYRGDPSYIIKEDPGILPEDNAIIIFTSGTTGLPKGVLSTQRMLLTVLLNSMVSALRGVLRRGEPMPTAPPPNPKGLLLPTPLFHITGTIVTIFTTMYGLKMVLMRKWVIEDAAKLIRSEDIGGVAGVPSLAHDLAGSSLANYPLETVMLGGGPAHESLVDRTRKAFPNAVVSQAYGLTESNATAVTFSAEDYYARSKSCGVPLPGNDILIMNSATETHVFSGEVGEIWIRGPTVMKEYWDEPEATNKVLTKDGWLKTGDLGYQDEEGFLYIKDRQKDIIIRGGENIDSVTVENALYTEPAVFEAAAVGIPDIRLGELVAAVVTLNPAVRSKMTEKEFIATASKSLPRFAVPVMVLVQDKPFDRTPSGKIIKVGLRKVAAEEWAKRVPSSKM
ncbi:hypothetical protein BDZ94DRAFT_1257980 [Collybia nuda]|uniref:4-coumarate--CoA ligase n=1 Tax=Collybia nuda TaxID=64659 RepID=A0A9P5Y7S6_9AGAR|nr:hypothetical protein BDZ94DRAFT_1257980 [Collybia nuda]